MKFNKIKTFLLQALDILPSNFGYLVYHQLQRRSFKNIETAITANNNSYQIIKTILTENGITLKNKNVVEIGSGWMPLMPYLLKTNENIDTLFTYDINKHYSNKRIAMVNTYYKEFNFKLVEKKGFFLPDFIDYYPKQNIINAHLPKNCALYFSRFVLEHVSPQDIEAIHRKLFNTMEEGSAILHLISPSDHRAYSDASLSHYDFLKYSEKEWNAIQTKFDYHNRLRLPQYINIFKKIGFEIAYLEYDKVAENSEKFKKYKELKIHSDFENFSDDEILAGSINVLLKKPTHNL